jgi:subtilisin family serine protease
MMGGITRAWIAAEKSGEANFGDAYERELAKIVNQWPYDVVQNSVKQQKASMEIISKNLMVGQIGSTVQPMLDASGGEMSKDIATMLLGAYVNANAFIPNKERSAKVFSDYLAAHEVKKPDIWKARNVELPKGSAGEPVVAVWDSGVDTEIFVPLGQMWTNTAEIPENGIDDDGNGFIDDVHGIAFTLDDEKTVPLLRPMVDTDLDQATLQRYAKGLSDMQTNIDSDEAAEIKRAIGSLEPDQVRPFIEEVNAYSHLSHGTHVAGITAEGNPNIKIVAVRMTFDHRMVPDAPTIAKAYRGAAAAVEIIDYLKANNVKVVNMSWGGSYGGIESALEMNNVGETPEERKELARKIFRIGRDALYDAMAGAPEILFVTSAGNSDSDNEFEEFIPSSFEFDNIMTVGAVDQAGDETSFTSFGKVDVYANGFQVESYVPGGDRLPMSGTSMSSPNVVNLAGKLLAVEPSLTPDQLRELIEGGCDEHQTGDRTVRLINPKKSMELLAQRNS